MKLRTKDLSKIGYHDHIARSLAIEITGRHCKHATKEEVMATLTRLLEVPESYKGNVVWGKLADRLLPDTDSRPFTEFNLVDPPLPYKIYGSKFIESAAKQQMTTAMRLPVTISGALMPDAHAGYGLPIGGVLAVDNAVIPYAVGLDIGCRMNLTVFDTKTDFLKRYSHKIQQALKSFTHFGMEGGLPTVQQHEITDREEFRMTPLLRGLKEKAIRQLGTSGGGNHFVEFGEISVKHGNALGIPAGSYTALLSHSGSRGIGAAIATHYSSIARDLCHLPREAQHFAWLNLDSEPGQEYWMSMNLAGDYAAACHQIIHRNLAKALGLRAIANVGNHHNFAWDEEIAPGERAIVHRKGATPAHTGTPGLIPGSMATEGYLVVGRGEVESLCSASHGSGRAMSRQKARESFTNSEMKKYLQHAGVTLIGGSIEEMPLAYKDISRIMPLQEQLIEIQGRFMPRIVRMDKK